MHFKINPTEKTENIKETNTSVQLHHIHINVVALFQDTKIPTYKTNYIKVKHNIKE